MLKLDYIYLFIGSTTMVLNLIVTLHFAGGRKRVRSTAGSAHDEIISFSLSEAGRGDNGTTEPFLWNDTEILQ